MKAKDISRAILQSYSSPFKLRLNFLAIENLSWGLFRWGESDLLICSKAHYLTDIEVKLTISDLKADFQKKKWNPSWIKTYKKDIAQHYYAIPLELLEKAQPIIEENRPDSGIITVESRKSYSTYVRRVKHATKNKEAKKIEDKTIINLCRLAMFRYYKDQNESNN